MHRKSRGKGGKSLFFDKGVQQLIRNSDDCHDVYIRIGVEFYIKWIYRKLHANAIDCIRIFGKSYETPHIYLFPLGFFCEKIFNKHNKPYIVIFDNIDLASVKTQKMFLMQL